MGRSKPGLAEWWDKYLTDAQRTRLMEEVELPLDPDFALELWRGSGVVRVVEPAEPSWPTDPGNWRLTPDVITFVMARARERTRDEG